MEAQEGQGSPLKDWLENLRAGGAVAMGRKVDLGSFRVSPDQIVAVAALHVWLGCLSGWLLAEPPKLFDWSGAALQALVFAILLLLAWAGARGTRSDRLAATVLVLLAALWPLWLACAAQAALPIGDGGGGEGWIVPVLRGSAVLWGLCVLVRALQVGCGLPAWQGFALGASWVVATILLLESLELEPYWTTDWVARWEEERALEESAEEIDAEAVIYAQHELLSRSVSALEPGRPGVTDLYFLGFAADSGQAVFRREVLATRAIFDARFDTDGRSAVLVNHADTRDELPIASASSLAIVLRAFAARMDLNEDVLFLFLTGHGSEEKGLSVDFERLPLNDLGPATLARLLDEAGIRWRVLVVSACYSGGFIGELENEETLLLTASAADRRSFGCSNEAEWTWFGRAFFEEALAREIDFEAAFQRARARIAVWEAEEEKTPSQPQISAGHAIRARLELLKQRL